MQFFLDLEKLVKEGVIPVGYGLYEDEWEDGKYPLFETLHVGKCRGGGEIRNNFAQGSDLAASHCVMGAGSKST